MHSPEIMGTMAKRRPSLALLTVCLHACGSAVLCVVLGLLVGETQREGWQLAVRYSARVACLWFLAAYVARPVHTLFGSRFTLSWQTWRRRLGLAFASAMGVHFVAVVIYLAGGGSWPRPVSL